MAGLDPAIQASAFRCWMPGSGPGMTSWEPQSSLTSPQPPRLGEMRNIEHLTLETDHSRLRRGLEGGDEKPLPTPYPALSSSRPAAARASSVIVAPASMRAISSRRASISRWTTCVATR